MNQSINTDSKNSKEPQQKYRLGTVSIKILGGLKPVLQAPNLALSFCYITVIMNNRNENVKHKTKHLVLRKAGWSAIEVRWSQC